MHGPIVSIQPWSPESFGCWRSGRAGCQRGAGPAVAGQRELRRETQARYQANFRRCRRFYLRQPLPGDVTETSAGQEANARLAVHPGSDPTTPSVARRPPAASRRSGSGGGGLGRSDAVAQSSQSRGRSAATARRDCDRCAKRSPLSVGCRHRRGRQWVWTGQEPGGDSPINSGCERRRVRDRGERSPAALSDELSP